MTDRDTKGALKARLRADILNISRQNGFSSKETSRTPLDLEEKAIVSLMYKFLKSRNMDVVLSILLPAVGMHSPRDVLNDQDIAAFLNLTPSDDTTTPGTLFVFCFILNIIYIFWFLFNLELRPRI